VARTSAYSAWTWRRQEATDCDQMARSGVAAESGWSAVMVQHHPTAPLGDATGEVQGDVGGDLDRVRKDAEDAFERLSSLVRR
jgi:hypothetical protein